MPAQQLSSHGATGLAEENGKYKAFREDYF